MSNYVAIMKWDVDNRVSKYMIFDVQENADNFVTDNISGSPQAFVVIDPPADPNELKADPDAKTVSFFAKPDPPTKSKTVRLDEVMTRDETYKGLLLAIAKQQGLTEAAMRVLVEAEMQN